jgi:hypothetical protein
VVQPTDHLEVLVAGEVLVDRRVLAGQPDPAADAMRVSEHVDASHRCPAGVRLQQGRQYAYGRGLAGTVRAEKAEHRAAGHGQVNPVECHHLLVALDQSGRLDRQLHGCDTSPCLRQLRSRLASILSRICGV